MYKIVRFDFMALMKQVVIIFLIALVLTLLGKTLSQPAWVKSGENFVLFYPVLVGILLYGFSVSAVFQTGQATWNELVDAVQQDENEKVARLINRKPDAFPTILVVLGWALLSLCSLFIQIPYQMTFLMFTLHVVITTPVLLAFDYWGYTSGIKRIERTEQ